MEQATLQISTKGDGTLTANYTEPNYSVISALIARKRRPTPLDALALDQNAAANSAPCPQCLPTDDLLLICFNELEKSFGTKCLGYTFGKILNDGFKKYLKGKQAQGLHYGKSLHTEADILAIHKPDLALVKSMASGTVVDIRKVDLGRPWNSENKVQIRLNVTEWRVTYKLMDYFKAGFKDTLTHLMFDAVSRYLDELGAADKLNKPPRPDQPKGGAS